MRRTPSSLRRKLRAAAVLAGVALAAPLVVPGAASADHTPLPATVSLMGSLQSELGCAGDWDGSCTSTDLAPAGGTRYELVGSLPAGSYEYKVRLDRSWSENYGADGERDGANIPLVLLHDAEVRFTYDHATHRVTVAPAEAPPAREPGDRALGQASLRRDLTRERFYFVMPDRFENGDTSNDLGGHPPVREASGYDPTARGWYHGGDLRGLIDRLDYVRGLGTTAIWLTPSFKNKPVQGTGEHMSAGYHGYWITDFTQIDPHLGTNADLEELVDAAHARGMKVFFDVITNHTADVIDYEEKRYSYVPKRVAPYRDAHGQVFDDRDYAGTGSFPELDREESFPYTPVFPTPADETVKVPSWLNDPTLYHNRGNAQFDGGESDEYGDFFGLDDLFTEHPRVVQGMKDIYRAWVDLGIDGFRIDTVKHVDMPFWQDFAPAIQQHAAERGRPRFFSFGEVFDADPRRTSAYTTEGRLQATLDFPFQHVAARFAQGDRPDLLRQLFASDDWYTDADSNAYSLPTFLGNHDMGRIGLFLGQSDPSASDAELLARDRLAHSLMYLVRGQPVVYYGDEQGFVGDGGDQLARQDMHPSRVAEYNDDDLIGTDATTAESNFDPSHPVYRHLADLSALREAHPTLADGAQVHRTADDASGVYAFSRISDDDDVEYVVAVNSSERAATTTVRTFSKRTAFSGVWPAGTPTARSDSHGDLTLVVPPLSAVVHRAAVPLRPSHAARSPRFVEPRGWTVAGRAEVAVTVPGGGFDQVTLAYRPAGGTAWTPLGTDDAAPYRVFHDVRGFAEGTLLEYRAVVRDHSGNVAAASTHATVGPAPVEGGDGLPAPQAVSVPGSFNSELGCASDWDPACPQAQLAHDAASGTWSATLPVPAGTWEYKVAHDGSWDVNFGADGQRNGPNIPLTTSGGPVTFRYDPETHVVSAQEG